MDHYKHYAAEEDDPDLSAALQMSLQMSLAERENHQADRESEDDDAIDDSNRRADVFFSAVTAAPGTMSNTEEEIRGGKDKLKKRRRDTEEFTEQHAALKQSQIRELLAKNNLTDEQLVSFVSTLKIVAPFCKDLMEIIAKMYNDRNEYRKTFERATLFRQNLDSWLNRNIPECVCLTDCAEGTDDVQTLVKSKVKTEDNAGSASASTSHREEPVAQSRTAREEIVECLLANYDSQVSKRFENHQKPPSKEQVWQCESLVDCLVLPLLELKDKSAKRARFNKDSCIPSCPVCLTKPVECVLPSCGHTICSDCGKDLDSFCPVCRRDLHLAQPSSALLKIYFA